MQHLKNQKIQEMENRDYLLINDIQILGKFLLHYGSIYDHPNKECMRAVLKINKKSNDHFYFTPGYRSYEQQYFQCPLSILYTQLNWIETIEEGDYTSLKAEIVVFSKNYKQSRTICLNQSISQRGSRPPLNPMDLNNVVNSINYYIEAGYNIDLLDSDYLDRTINIKALSPIDLLRMINMLEFKFYANDLVRVGKDNLFWNEIIITKLPKNIYLGKLFETILLQSGIVDSAELREERILATYNRHYSYSPSSGKETIGLDIKKTEEIKDYLKLNILNVFDSKTELNERLIIRDPTC